MPATRRMRSGASLYPAFHGISAVYRPLRWHFVAASRPTCFSAGERQLVALWCQLF